MVVFSRVFKNKSKALVTSTGQMAEQALHQGNFKRATDLLLQDFEKTAKKLDLVSRLHDSRKIKSLRAHSKRQLRVLAKKVLMIYYLRDNPPIEDVSKTLGRLMSRSRRLYSLRCRLNKKTQARVVQEVELEVLAEKQPQRLATLLRDDKYYTQVKQELRLKYQIKANEKILQALKDDISRNRSQLSPLCLRLAKLHQSFNDSKAYEYYQQQLIYSQADPRQRLKEVFGLIQTKKPASLQAEQLEEETLSLQLRVAMFAFRHDYCDFNFKIQYMHYLIAKLYRLKRYNKLEFQILHSYVSLAHCIYKQKALSLSSLKNKITQSKVGFRRLKKGAPAEVRQAHQLLVALQAFANGLSASETENRIQSEDLRALLVLAKKHWLSSACILQCLQNFISSQQLQLSLK